jgi:hypothetical protein
MDGSKPLNQGGLRMKKGLVVALTLLTVALMALPVFALDVQFSGEYRVRGFYYDSIYATKPAFGPAPTFTNLGDAAQTANFLDQRFRLTSRITAGMTTGVVQLDFLNVTGNTTNFGNREFGQNFNYGTYSGFGGESNSIGVRQAYLVVNLPVARLYAGRPEVTLGHGLTLKDTVDLIGIGTQIPIRNVPIEIQVAYGKLGEQDNATTGHTKDLDLDFYAMTMALKGQDNSFGGFIFYGGQRKEGCTSITLPGPVTGCVAADTTFMPTAAAIHDLRELMFGLTADGKVSVPGMGALRYAGEFDNFTGTNFDGRGILGYNFYGDIGADVNLPGAGTASVGVAFLRVQGPSPNDAGKVGVNSLKGDFKFANILFSDSTNNYDGVDFNQQFAEGLIGCNPNTLAKLAVPSNCSAQNTSLNHNIQAFKVYAGMKPTEKTNIEVGVLPYVWAVRSPAPAGVGQNVGFEIDANAGYRFDDNLKLTAGYGFFNPGDAFSGPPTLSAEPHQEKNVQKVEIALTYTF